MSRRIELSRHECYAALGLPYGADEADIAKAYKKLAVIYHPDKNLDDRENAEETFKKVSEAYALLCSPHGAVPSSDDLISPPRNWPACFKEDCGLQAFLQKTLGGRRVRLCGAPPAADVSALGEPALEFSRSDSLRNCELVRHRTGWGIVGGFALFERVDAARDADTADRFEAVPRYWSSNGRGTWVDFTPRPSQARQLVLVESPKTPLPAPPPPGVVYTQFRGVTQRGNKFKAQYTGTFVDETRDLGSYTTARAAAAAWAHYNKHGDVDQAKEAGRSAEAIPVGPLLAT